MSQEQNCVNPAFANVNGTPKKNVGDESDRKPRSSSFKDSDKYVRTGSGTFVRQDSDFYGRMGSETMPEFRSALKERMKKTKDELPTGLMREVLETYKPHILSRRRRLIEDCVRDLRLNNDHIHIVEQEMRKSIDVSYLLLLCQTLV